LHKAYVKHLNCKLYYQQLHLKYLCNLAWYWLQFNRSHPNVFVLRSRTRGQFYGILYSYATHVVLLNFTVHISVLCLMFYSIL